MQQQLPIQVLQGQKLLLEMEYYSEKETFRKQTEALGMQRKIKRGDAWYPLRVGKRFYNGLNQLCVEVFRTQDLDIEHNFEFGRPLLFFKYKKGGTAGQKLQISYYSFTGMVSFVDR